jgi:multiple sugar transport system ATP-binding protein
VQFGGTVPVPRNIRRGHGQTVTPGFPPGDLEQVAQAKASGVEESTSSRELGADAYVYSHTTLDGQSHDIVARVDDRRPR